MTCKRCARLEQQLIIRRLVHKLVDEGKPLPKELENDEYAKRSYTHRLEFLKEYNGE